MIDLELHPDRLQRAVRRARERGIIVPTFAQMKDPQTIPTPIVDRLGDVGLWDLHPLNLFRITWKNEPVKTGGRFGDVAATPRRRLVARLLLPQPARLAMRKPRPLPRVPARQRSKEGGSGQLGVGSRRSCAPGHFPH